MKLDHATRFGPFGRTVLLLTLTVARWADNVIHCLSGGRTDAPLAWLVITRT